MTIKMSKDIKKEKQEVKIPKMKEVKVYGDIKLPIPGIPYSNSGVGMSITESGEQVDEREMLSAGLKELLRMLREEFDNGAKGIIDEMVTARKDEIVSDLESRLEQGRKAYKNLLEVARKYVPSEEIDKLLPKKE